jgi:hypothetical protein
MTVYNGASWIRSHCVTACTSAAQTYRPTTAARAQILGHEITINTVYNKPLIGIQGSLHPTTPHKVHNAPEQPNDGEVLLHTAVGGLRIGPSYKAHRPAQPISITNLSTGLGSIFLHISLLLFSQDGHSSGRIRVLRKFRVVSDPQFFHISNSHVHDVIRGKPSHNELPCRRGDACYARLARCVEGDAFATNAP